MPRSSQTYSLITADRQEIRKVLGSIQASDKTKFPFREDVKNLAANITIERTDGVRESLYVEFNVKKPRCYIIGSSKSRDVLVRLLNEKFEPDGGTMVIQTMRLRGESVYTDMLKIVTKTHPKNFIKTLSVKFGMSGFASPLDHRRVSHIMFGFTKYTCASEHKSSKEYVKKAQSCRVKFGVWKLGSFSRDHGKEPMSLDVTTDYTFRLFWDYSVEEILLIMKTLDIDPDAYQD